MNCRGGEERRICEAELTDEDLAREFQEGNEAAFEALVHRFHGPLIGYLYRMCSDASIAEEVAQDCFLRFCSTVDCYRYPSPLKPYMFAIAANRLKDHFRSAYARQVDVVPNVDVDSVRCAAAQGDACDEAVRRIDRREVARTLAQLPYLSREVLVLRFYQDLTVPEIAQALSIPPGTVKSRLHTAINKLKHAITADEEAGACQVRQMLEAIGLWCLAGHSRWVIQGLDASFMPGITAVVGPNGSGKTTLIRHLATSRGPARGSVYFEGHRVDVRGASRVNLRWYRAQLGYMPQQFGLYPNLTQSQFVHYIAELKGIPASRRGEAVGAALHACGLEPGCDAPLGRMSEGERRRAAFAAAVVGCPRALLLDERMASCDPVERARMKRALRSMGPATTCLMSASSIADVDGLCDELMVLGEGRTVFAGRPGDLVDMARGSVFAGELHDLTLGQLSASARSALKPAPGLASGPMTHGHALGFVVTSWTRRGKVGGAGQPVGQAAVRVAVKNSEALPNAAEGGWREADPNLEEAYLWLRTFGSPSSYMG